MIVGFRKGGENMFVGFNIKVDSNEKTFSEFYKKGVEVLSQHKKKVTESMDKYLVKGGELSATEIEMDWFPCFDADVFLSHSHKDEKFVVSLAGWLYDVFGIMPFVDSCIWNYSNDLLKIIDDKYSVKKVESNGGYTYSYEKRNISTSHVHLLLNGALAKMIDHTECLIFVNTPYSLKTEEIMKQNTTDSPWIYSELLLSKIIRHKKLNEYRSKVVNEKFAHSDNSLHMRYDVELDHLYDIDVCDLINIWKYTPDLHNSYSMLDFLYTQKGII